MTCSFSGVVEDRKEERERGVVYGTPKRYLLLFRKNNTFSKYKTFFIKNKLSFRKSNDFTKRIHNFWHGRRYAETEILNIQ